MSNIFQKYIFYKKEIDKRRGGGKKGQKEGKREGKKQKNFEIMQGDGGVGFLTFMMKDLKENIVFIK